MNHAVTVCTEDREVTRLCGRLDTDVERCQMVNLDVILTLISIEVFHEEPAHLTFQADVVLNRLLQFRLADTVVALQLQKETAL